MSADFVHPACLEGLHTLKQHHLVAVAAPPVDIFAAPLGETAAPPDEGGDADPRRVASWSADGRVRFDGAGRVTALDLGGRRLRRAPPSLGGFAGLTTLSLAGTHLPAADACAVLSQVRGRVERLHLGGNGWGPGGATALAASEFFADNGRDSRLRKLDLRYNDLGDAGVATIVEALANAAHLQHLYLEGNRIGDAGCAALARWLATTAPFPCPLRGLYLGDNAIGPAGARALAGCLRGGGGGSGGGLSTLYLEGNRLGDEGVTAFCQALEDTDDGAAVPRLYLENNTQLSKAVSERLKQALRRRARVPEATDESTPEC